MAISISRLSYSQSIKADLPRQQWRSFHFYLHKEYKEESVVKAQGDMLLREPWGGRRGERQHKVLVGWGGAQ